jgi:hypothetical protein
VNLNVGLKDECAGLTDEIAGLKLRLQILAGEAASATASGNGTEIRCLQPTPLAAFEMAALQTENDALKDRLQDIEDLLDSGRCLQQDFAYGISEPRCPWSTGG